MKRKICYLCGKSGANSRDHVPPKCFLPTGNFGRFNRITLMTHKECNLAYSKDEEYLRDLVGPPAIDYPDGIQINETTKRAWQRPAGSRRLRMMLKDAIPMEIRSPSGIFIRKAIGIKVDYERVRRVGLKIAQGILYHDIVTFVSQDDIKCIPLSTIEILKERERESKKGNPFWLSLSNETCLHDVFSNSVAARRAYLGIESQPVVKCICCMVIMIYSQSFFVLAEVSFGDRTPGDIPILIASDELLKNLPSISKA